MRNELTEVVISTVQEYRRRKSRPAVNSRLIQDLNLASDDATSIVITLERRFSLKGSQDEWARVSTIADVVDLISALLGRTGRQIE